MKLIVAAGKNWEIGKENQLLCHLPGDLKYFKERTQGKTVIMGRKTLESLPGGKPLPKRRNIVLTTDSSFEKEGCEIAHSIDEILELIGNDSEAMVMGGGTVYRQLLPYCESCYITKIDKSFNADTYFPDLDSDDDFELVWQSDVNRENDIEYVFTEYKRK